MMNNKLIEDL